MTTASSLKTDVTPYDFGALVVGLHLRWDGVFQRPQHLLTRLAQRIPVIVIEEPLVDGTERLETIVDGNVTVLRPHCVLAPQDVVAASTISSLKQCIGAQRPLVWLYTPMMVALADAFDDAPLVFDAMDELKHFAKSDNRIEQREAGVLERAAIVFCGGPSLYRSRADKSANVHLYSSGVDVEFFERARNTDGHAALANLRRPIFGYVGVLDERIDFGLIAAIADARNDATIVLVGPVTKIDPATLPVRDNILYLGQQPYSDLPAFLAGFDIALMPFALNASTQNISPTKTLEYLAAGKTVVSTPVPDVASEYGSIVTIASTTADFIAALKKPDTDASWRRAVDDRTRAATWDAIVGSMLGDLAALGITPVLKGRIYG